MNATIITLSCSNAATEEQRARYVRDIRRSGALLLTEKQDRNDPSGQTYFFVVRADNPLRFQQEFGRTESSEQCTIMRADKAPSPMSERPIMVELSTAVNLGIVRDNRSAKARWLRERGLSTKEIAELLGTDYNSIYSSLRYVGKTDRQQRATA